MNKSHFGKYNYRNCEIEEVKLDSVLGNTGKK